MDSLNILENMILHEIIVVIRHLFLIKNHFVVVPVTDNLNPM